METVSATLVINVQVDCPKCAAYIDLLDERETDNYNHNEEGAVIMQACPDGHWCDKHAEFNVRNVTCSECKTSFNVETISW